jgi:hypothetical protein
VETVYALLVSVGSVCLTDFFQHLKIEKIVLGKICNSDVLVVMAGAFGKLDL